jgi:hypothetical protein
MATQQASTYVNNAFSKGEDVSEIDSLAQKVTQLSASADFWNKAILWCLGAAALAAVFIVITTRLAILRTGQLSDAQGELANAKERGLASDLRAKDLQIAGLDKEAAELRVQLVKQDLRGNLFNDAKKRTAFVVALKPFAKTKVAIRWLPPPMWDNEMTFLSLHLMGAFTEAQWQITDMGPTLLGGGVGVLVDIDPKAPPATKTAATALAEALTNLGLMRGPLVMHTSGKPDNPLGDRHLETPGVEGIILEIQAHP